MKCRMMVFHQITRVKKHVLKKNISQFKCSRLSLLKIFLVPYMNSLVVTCDKVSGAFLGHCIEFALWKGSADIPPICSQDFGPFAENGLIAFQRAKMSSEDTQHKYNKLHFSSENQIES